jgi:hypothetical protein
MRTQIDAGLQSLGLAHSRLTTEVNRNGLIRTLAYSRRRWCSALSIIENSCFSPLRNLIVMSNVLVHIHTHKGNTSGMFRNGPSSAGTWC